MARRSLLALCVALGVGLAAGCEAEGAPRGFFDPCATDADCPRGFECMAYVHPPLDGGMERQVCTQPCVTAGDCPHIPNDHCGDLRMCAPGQGVCAITRCR